MSGAWNESLTSIFLLNFSVCSGGDSLSPLTKICRCSRSTSQFLLAARPTLLLSLMSLVRCNKIARGVGFESRCCFYRPRYGARSMSS
uniref:Rap guanine nucleotide exchange factor 2 n=1 Tax=Parascaris univalens TaxID=6257 RepID=A0A914ZUM6_PARUN